MDGFIWGGFVGDTLIEENLRIGGTGFFKYTGTSPGWIQENGAAVEVNDPRVRIYRIRQDFKLMTNNELRKDASSVYQIEEQEVTQAQIDAVREQYRNDWAEWPVDIGAPYYDENGNGIYDPVLDAENCPIIGLLGEDSSSYTTYYDRPD